jgi:hypothetical protein
MTNEQQEDQWRQDGIRWGIIAGGIVVVLFASVYFVQKELVLSRGLWLSTYVVYIFAMWKAQSKVEGTELKSYIQPGFMVFVVANALFYFYYHLLFAVFDPELVKLQGELMATQGYDPKDAVMPTVGGSFFAYAQSLIPGFLLATSIGFILSRRR